MAQAVHPEPDFKHPGLLAVLYRVPLLRYSWNAGKNCDSPGRGAYIAGQVFSGKVSTPQLSSGSPRAS